MAVLSIEKLKWITEDQIRSFGETYDTPYFLYSEDVLRSQIQKVLQFPVNDGYGFQPRYAMKANPNGSLLRIMKEMGIQIDAGSEYEVIRAVKAGFQPDQIQLTAQQLATNLTSLVNQGVQFTACSLRQLEEFGMRFPGKGLGIRFNPGLGSGGCTKTNVGGPSSSFGIWHEKMDKVKEIISKYNLTLHTIHTHIGSGSDPEVWKTVASMTLALVVHFPDVVTVNLGGGFKVGRMEDEGSTDLQVVGKPVKELFHKFFTDHGRKLKLEIEPGSFYMVNTGIIVAKVDDIVDTGTSGMKFLKLNAGMDQITRPSLYGARHPIIIVSNKARTNTDVVEYVVSGHCCESGDFFTQEMGGDPDPRAMAAANIGDYAVIGGSGAYCASMCTKNYNSFPEVAEYLLSSDGTVRCIRKVQTLDQILANEQ